MVAVALCFVMGVWLGDQLSIPIYVIGVVIALLSLLRRYRVSMLLICLSVGALWSGLQPREELPTQRCYLHVRVDSPRQAIILGVCESDEWQNLNQSVAVSGEKGVELWGEEVLIWGQVWRFGNRDYLSLDRSTIVERNYDRSTAATLSDLLVSRVEQQELTPTTEALVEAMVLGRRESLKEEVMTAFRESGAAHILSVSGLHVGIVSLIFMFLFKPLTLIWRGSLYRSIAVVVIIWIYAAVVGMTPSVVRAAFMFSALHMAPILGRRYRSLTVLSLVVIVLTLFDPRIIYDVGFQLSIIAVLSILLWAMPLWRRVKLGLWGEVFVLPIWMGICCSVAMMPILAVTFGYVSIVGVVLNTLMIMTLCVILFVSIIQMTLGISLLSPLIELSAWLQIESVEWASTGWRSAINVEITPTTAILIYVLYGVLTYCNKTK